MKIIVLYGLGEVEKRNELLKIKRRFPEQSVVQLDFKQDSWEKLTLVLAAQTLFEGGPRLVIVENASEKLDLKKLPDSLEDVLLITASSLRNDSLLLQTAKALEARVLNFEGEKELSAFPFLDALMEGKKEAFIELQKLLLGYGWMYVLTMVYYGLRRNILPLPASSFVSNKIRTQKKRYQTLDWEKMYQLTLATEFGIKSGALSEKVALAKLVQIILGKEWDRGIWK